MFTAELLIYIEILIVCMKIDRNNSILLSNTHTEWLHLYMTLKKKIINLICKAIQHPFKELFIPISSISPPFVLWLWNAKSFFKAELTYFVSQDWTINRWPGTRQCFCYHLHLKYCSIFYPELYTVNLVGWRKILFLQ